MVMEAMCILLKVKPLRVQDPNDPSNTHLHNNDAQRLQSPGRSSEQIFRLHPEHHALNCFGPTDMKKRHKLAVKRSWANDFNSDVQLIVERCAIQHIFFSRVSDGPRRGC